MPRTSTAGLTGKSRRQNSTGRLNLLPTFGGPGGGGPVDVVCKENVVTGILVGDEGVYTRTVNRLGVFCEVNAKAWRSDATGKLVSCEYSSAYRSSVIAEGPGGPGGWTLDPEAEFEGPKATANEGFFEDDEVSRGEADQHCPCGRSPSE